RDLRVQGVPADRLHGQLSYREQAILYDLEGETLGGTFQLNGTYPFAQTIEGANNPRFDGRFVLRDLSLLRLWQHLRLRETLGDLRGRVSGYLNYRFDGSGWDVNGLGRFAIRNLRWGESLLTQDDIRGDLILRRGVVSIQDLTATIADGSLSG